MTPKAAKIKTLEAKAAGIRKSGERVVVHSFPLSHAAIPPCIFAWLVEGSQNATVLLMAMVLASKRAKGEG